MDCNSPIPSKKQKTNNEIDDGKGDHKDLNNYRFSDFEINKVLSENSQRKMMCVEGKFKEKDSAAVVIVEKTPLSKDTLNHMLSENSTTDTILENDIYGTYHLHPPAHLNALKATLIYPATEKHIAKYTTQDMFLIQESPNDYKTVTKRFIEDEQFSIQWVYNILSKKTESERIVYEDDDQNVGFILLPDMKWNGQDIEDLYLVAIVKKKDILSIRELTAEHLPLLENIRDNGLAAIKKKYGVGANQLRVYVHYQPSYYHLHVHFTHLKYDAPGSAVEKAHLLSDIIDNIHIDSLFYAKKTLTFTVKKSHGLYQKYAQIGRFSE